MCIDGKHCTYATPACGSGGIMIDLNTFVCPGQLECRSGFARCPSSVVTNLCMLDVSDTGKPEDCIICCGGIGDMSR